MDGHHNERLRLLEKTLADNPYHPVALLERVALHASAGDRTAAERSFSRVKPFLGSSDGALLLRDIASGKLAIEQRGDCYLIGQPDIAPGVIEQALEISRRVASDLETDPPCLLIGLIDDHMVSHCRRLVNGFGILFIAPKDLNDSVDSLLAHEITHGILSCGNGYLDEGLATYYEQRQRGGGNVHNGAELPKLRTLLRAENFADIARQHGDAYVRSIYDHGARVFKQLRQLRPEKKLAPFFENAVFSIATGQLTRDFQTYFDVDVDDLDSMVKTNAG
jgi:hypothetical protein